MTKQNKFVLFYALLDFGASFLAWILLYSYRKTQLEKLPFSLFDWISDLNFLLGITLIPLCWVGLFYVLDAYHNVFRKTLPSEITGTVKQCMIGVLCIFFVVLIDDLIDNYSTYYRSILVLFSLQFFLIIIGRFGLLTYISQAKNSGLITIPTLLIGSSQSTIRFIQAIRNDGSMGRKIVGYLCEEPLSQQLTSYSHLGKIENLQTVISKYDIQEIIITSNADSQNLIGLILSYSVLKPSLVVSFPPKLTNTLFRGVKMHDLKDEMLIEIESRILSTWQSLLKRSLDVSISILALVFLFPFLVWVALKTKKSSKGHFLYKQERLGLGGKPFMIYKFRSMHKDAEKHGPKLSSDNDERVTTWGKTMRRWRIDELPQFWNVLIGDMSLIGPRPERAYFLEKIALKAPYYRHVLRVKPGISSLGMVKYGYAENTSQMIQRMRYDILYIENISLLLDLKIALFTINTLMQGRGK